MKSLNKRMISGALLCACVVLIAVSGVIVNLPTATPKVACADAQYINNASDLLKAIQGGQSTIYVDDISFPAQTEIQLNYPVEIIGKSEKSVIENVNVKIIGTLLGSESVDVSIKNVIFDGKVKKSDIPFEEGKTYDEIVGEMNQCRCIDGCYGYYSLSVENCEIRNYLFEEGPAIYVDNNKNFCDGKRTINLANLKIHDNISNFGTVKIGSEITTTTIDNCDVFGNLAKVAQGMSVANGKATITNTLVHDNDFFRFADYMERELPEIYADDMMAINGHNYNNYTSGIGAMYIGGTNAVVDNCKIYNNQTVLGGGMGIANAQTLDKDERIEIRNTEIKNNKALHCGGGIYVLSNQGETTSFVNCNIVGNTAEKGSIVYTTTLAPYMSNYLGGKVEFLFCTLAGNEADDDNTFGFYDMIAPKVAGMISLKGCLVIDDAEYDGDGEEYNYIATKDKAIEDGIITADDVENCFANGIKPPADSCADVTVPASEYSTWSRYFSGATEDKKAGYFVPEQDDNDGQEEKDGKKFPYWTIVFPVIAVVGGAVILVLFARKKKGFVKTQGTADENQDGKANEEKGKDEKVDDGVDFGEYKFDLILKKMEQAYGGMLTNKEITVATYLLYDKSRKEIAKELVVSEETVKSHLKNIYKKTGVSSKAEFKQLIEKSIF